MFLTALDEVRQKDNGTVHHLPRHSWSYTNTKLRCQPQIKMSVSGAALASVPFFQVFPQALENVPYPWSHCGAMPVHSRGRISHWERSWWWKGTRISQDSISLFIFRFPFSFTACTIIPGTASVLSPPEIPDFATKGRANGEREPAQVREVFGIKGKGSDLL